MNVICFNSLLLKAFIQMTHQSGIHADDGVISELAECKRRLFRALRIDIENESLSLKIKIPADGSWEDDYNRAIMQLLDTKSPSYIFYRLDSTNSSGYDWIFISWMPENANVREKMLYASTRAIVRKQFGANLIKDELLAHTCSDVNLRGYKTHLSSKNAPEPYTKEELEMAGVRSAEATSGLHSACQTIGGVSFGISANSKTTLKMFHDGQYNYVQLFIDPLDELIKVSESHTDLTPRALTKLCPEKDGRYHLYRFRYEHEGATHTSLFFIHTIAGYQSSVKSRMLYSSCKAALITQLDQEFQIHFDHRLETDNMDEFTSEYLLDIIYPRQPEAQIKVQKPQGPAGRRPRTHKI